MKRLNTISDGLPRLWVSVTPIAALILSMVGIIIFKGAYQVQSIGWMLLLGAALLAALISVTACRGTTGMLRAGLMRSARQILPSIPILFLIGTVSATWMLSGVVPLLIDFGLGIIEPKLFLLVACAVCSLISILTGSSWTTIATIGVAFMGIGQVLGYSPAWIAGAVISGAYFGDKISPLSDTTVLASSSSGVNLFTHIRYMLITTVPSMLIALAVFTLVGVFGERGELVGENEFIGQLSHTFNLTPWLMVVPALTGLLILMRLNVFITLAASTLLGLAAMFIAQPQIVSTLAEGASGFGDMIGVAFSVLGTSTSIDTGSESLNELVATGGAAGMLSTALLVTGAMLFGGALIGSGMLASITRSLRRHIRSPRATVSATVASGLALNSTTGDQYLSIVLSSNIFSPMYESNRLERRLLSRTVEDSVSVTSVLIPWNSCGLTQSAVLGVSTLAYFPCCIFNLLSPLMSMFMAWAGIKIHRPEPVVTESTVPA